MDVIPPETSPALILGLYTAEAERINRWINVGFTGLVGAVDEKELQLSEYEETLSGWHESCVETLNTHDETVEEIVKPKKRWLLF